MTDERLKTRAKTLKMLEEKFPSLVMDLRLNPAAKIDAIPTGILTMDAALGIGGVPRGRIFQVSGNEDIGKSTMALGFAASVMRRGGISTYIESEGKINAYWVRALFDRWDIDWSKLVVVQEQICENIFEIIVEMCPTNDAIILDSIGNMTTKGDASADVGDSMPAMVARKLSVVLPQMQAAVARATPMPAIFFVNQLTTQFPKYGTPQPDTEKGGKKLRYNSTIIVRLTKGVSRGGRRAVKATIRKNHISLGNWHKEFQWSIIPGEGIDHEEDMIRAGKMLGVIGGGTSRASWHKDEQGGFSLAPTAAIKHLREDPDGIQEELRSEVEDALAAIRSEALAGTLANGPPLEEWEKEKKADEE